MALGRPGGGRTASSHRTTSKDVGPYLNRYACQQLTTGPQARTYADHFIAVHLEEMSGGQTYAQLSAKAQAQPNNAALAGAAIMLIMSAMGMRHLRRTTPATEVLPKLPRPGKTTAADAA